MTLKDMGTAISKTNHDGGVMAGLPVWVKAIATVGAPIVFAAWLIYFITSVSGAKLDAIQLSQIKAEADSELTRDDIRMFLNQHSKEVNLQKSILQQICANGAKNQVERNACFPEGR